MKDKEKTTCVQVHANVFANDCARPMQTIDKNIHFASKYITRAKAKDLGVEEEEFDQDAAGVAGGME